MARDLYDILDIPDNADTAWIRRAHLARCQAIESNAALSEVERKLQLRAVAEALATLTDPAKRAAYDAKLHEPPASYSIMSLLLTPGVLAFVFLSLITAFGFYVQHRREQNQLQLEQARIAAEVALATRELEQRKALERERIAAMAENDRLRLEQQQRNQFNRERQQLATWQRQVEYDTRRKEQQAFYVERQQAWLEEQAQRRERLEQEYERRRLAAELERQKRFIRESERR